MELPLQRALVARLTGGNFTFCDDNDVPRQQIEKHEKFSLETRHLENLLEEGISASSTDAPEQSIHNTLSNDDSFWSSTGTFENEKETVQEWLTFKLKGPFCVVHSVQISVYRASYQLGQPIYPPMAVNILIGSPKLMKKCLPDPVPILVTDAVQVIPLPYKQQQMGEYLKIAFYGKIQAQMEDNAYYIAIRHIEARGLDVQKEGFRFINFVQKSLQTTNSNVSTMASVFAQYRFPDGRSIRERIQNKSKKETKTEDSESVKDFQLKWTEAENSNFVFDCQSLL